MSDDQKTVSAWFGPKDIQAVRRFDATHRTAFNGSYSRSQRVKDSMETQRLLIDELSSRGFDIPEPGSREWRSLIKQLVIDSTE
jgi:hypothetical protein